VGPDKTGHFRTFVIFPRKVDIWHGVADGLEAGLSQRTGTGYLDVKESAGPQRRVGRGLKKIVWVATGGYPPVAPAVPYVRTLAHTVPQFMDSLPDEGSSEP